jgi:glycosyltransferase involved in cell wall biosynthesis
MSLTFIIPTIGRPSLKYAIKSLKDQTIQNWNAIIIFDGIKCNIENNDSRIQIIEIEKKGININSAGNVRNYGM